MTSTSVTIQLPACGRDYAIRQALGNPTYSVGDDGFPPGIQVRVLTDRHHASIEKAAAVVGIGRRNIVELIVPIPSIQSSPSRSLIEGSNHNKMDLDNNAGAGTAIVEFADVLERELPRYREADQPGNRSRYALIVVVSFAEVNTVSTNYHNS